MTKVYVSMWEFLVLFWIAETRECVTYRLMSEKEEDVAPNCSVITFKRTTDNETLILIFLVNFRFSAIIREIHYKFDVLFNYNRLNFKLFHERTSMTKLFHTRISIKINDWDQNKADLFPWEMQIILFLILFKSHKYKFGSCHSCDL